MKKKPAPSPIPFERISHAIFEIRGHKVMLDTELAALYGVETKLLNRAVRRNLGYGNDSRQTGPLSSRFLHNAAAGRFAFYVQTRPQPRPQRPT